MNPRYPDYDVQSKRAGPSWDPITRHVIDQRLAVSGQPRFLEPSAFRTLVAVCARILPQPADRPLVPLASMVDKRLKDDRGDGYRDSRMPPLREAWRRGLTALDAEARAAYGKDFAALRSREQDQLLELAQAGDLRHAAWQDMPCELFFTQRVLHDITAAYYGHPTAWNEIGFGGPANPRGYVRLAANHRDAWEPAEAHPGAEQKARELNHRVR
ncbi:gluconate 2-dehydrogenase subunit 3 family protein [Pseudomonas sp.]|uniref:gluconate 2-dehydrogenase subunit 3 family protein n=1 Tax=Pseudomonas sp. TaxID=306 RepID=UPI00272A5A6D|nr:gluconate 2-dehydrogenase subunit 3 family protein [Pseudomonas sp.]